MRKLIVFLVIAISSARSQAGTPCPFIDSAVIENLFIRIDLAVGTTNLSAMNKINFCFLTRTNEVAAIYFPKPEYCCQLQLVDGGGIPVPRTHIGKRFGQQFSDLKKYSWELVNKRGYNTGGSDRPDMILSNTNGSDGRDLPAVQDLFEIKKTGVYKLSLQFQIFKMVGSGPSHAFEIVRIPPVQIPVIKLTVP